MKQLTVYEPARQRCRSWVIRCVFVQPRRRHLSVVSPIGDKRERGWFVRDVPEADSCTAAK